jgi:hypothetical protein
VVGLVSGHLPRLYHQHVCPSGTTNRNSPPASREPRHDGIGTILPDKCLGFRKSETWSRIELSWVTELERRFLFSSHISYKAIDRICLMWSALPQPDGNPYAYRLLNRHNLAMTKQLFLIKKAVAPGPG